jgi:DNA (cytosine-5)-methyltransferase 1
MNELLCGSLFSGVGGMDIGFARAGFRHAFFAEIEPFGRAVLAARFPGVPIYEDVRDVPECGSGTPWGVTRSGERLEIDGGLRRSVADGNAAPYGDGASHERPDSVSRSRLDVLTFGSPCQDLSVAGKRAGLDGDRSGLFWEAMRIAGDGPLRPRALLMENVEGLLSSNGGRDFALVLDAMAERGYRWSYRVLDSQHFGVPQRRRRVFVLAIADDDPRAERIGEVLALAEGSGGDSPTSDPAWPHVAARAGGGTPGGGGDGADAVIERERESRSRRHLQVGEGQRRTCGRRVPEPRVVGALTATYGEQSGQDLGPSGAGLVMPDNGTTVGFSHTQGLDPQAREEMTPTLRSNGGGAADGSASSVRRLTPLECERLQAWPEVNGRGWTDIPWRGKDHAPDSLRYRAAGNGVTATVAEWIASRLAEVLK